MHNTHMYIEASTIETVLLSFKRSGVESPVAMCCYRKMHKNELQARTVPLHFCTSLNGVRLCQSRLKVMHLINIHTIPCTSSVQK